MNQSIDVSSGVKWGNTGGSLGSPLPYKDLSCVPYKPYIHIHLITMRSLSSTPNRYPKFVLSAQSPAKRIDYGLSLFILLN